MWLAHFQQRARLDDGYLILSHFVDSARQTMQLRLPLNQATAWRSKLGVQQQKKYYSIGSLWCLLAHINIRSMREQMERFQQVGVPSIGINERREIEAYFTDAK